MESAAVDTRGQTQPELPLTAYPHYHQIFGGTDAPTGLLFDSQAYAVMSITYPPDSQTPDLNADKDGDRVLILVDGDLALQIGENRFRMGAGDAVKIPRGTRFGMMRSQAGARLMLIRAKPVRSFFLLR
jgi:quercetin dioxygenase-like cupin family protein